MLTRRALVMFLVVLMLALPVVAAAASAVEFEDGNLEAAVIQEFANLGKVVEESKIPQADMKLLKKLYANGPYTQILNDPPADPAEVIRDLTGLEYALKLDALNLSENFIKDLAPIRHLPLSYLNIEGNVDLSTGAPGFSLNPSSPQMKILQEIQHRGAVVRHDGLVKRISGPDRYQTAIRIWQNMYTGGFVPGIAEEGFVMEYGCCNAVVLARGDDFADALVGAPLAYALRSPRQQGFALAPILLTTPEKLHPATKAALINYIEKFEDELIDEFGGVFDVYVLGKEAAISERAVNELIYAIETEFDALDVRAIRVGGADRYETSVAIAKKLASILDEKFPNDTDGWEWNEIIFASGEDYPDALSAAPCAAAGGRYQGQPPLPILLTRGGSLPSCVTDYLKSLKNEIDKAVVTGGSAAISENVLSQLIGLKYRDAGTDHKVFDEVIRVWGTDRYATSVELAKYYYRLTVEDRAGLLSYIATGEDFADALTGAVLAASDHCPVLLVKQNAIPGPVEKVINFQDKTDPGLYPYLCILGGEEAVTLHNAVNMYNLVRYPGWAPR